MKKAYLNPRLYRVTVWCPFERTSYGEPVATAHFAGSAASLAWARHIGRKAAQEADGWYTIGEYDGGDWLAVNYYADSPQADYGDNDIPW